MSLEEKLEILYPSVSDEVIALIAEQARAFVLEYCHIEEIPESLQGTLLEMCKQDINKLGAEGLSSEGAGGSSVAYATDYTERVYKVLKRHKRFIFM